MCIALDPKVLDPEGEEIKLDKEDFTQLRTLSWYTGSKVLARTLRDGVNMLLGWVEEASRK